MLGSLFRGPRRGRHSFVSAFAAAILTCAHSVAFACPAGITVTTVPEGRILADIDVDGAKAGSRDHDFALVYLHSVTLTPVESRYRLEIDGFRQVAELFAQHGPGLAAEPVAGEPPWRIEDGRFRVGLDRELPRIRLRVDPDYRNRLVTAEREIDLTQWGRRALELRVRVCDEGSG
jgi:GNAT superfamily N-acetyltransferase